MNIQTKKLEGRTHLVVPVVMGVVGVWTANHGSLLYLDEDLRKSVPLWNGRPVVVYHPDLFHNLQAGVPEVFDRQRVGTIFNARFDSKQRALKAEAWLDPERLARVDPRVLRAVNAGQVMEVSTGLWTDGEVSIGTFNGEVYEAIARNHRPDHLAILPDQRGACSVAMGAGLCRNRFEEVHDEEVGELIDDEPALLVPAMRW